MHITMEWTNTDPTAWQGESVFASEVTKNYYQVNWLILRISGAQTYAELTNFVSGAWGVTQWYNPYLAYTQALGSIPMTIKIK